MELPGVRRLYKRYGRYLDHRRVRAGLRKVHVVSEERLGQICEDYYTGLISRTLMILILMVVLMIAAGVKEFSQERKVVLDRDSYGGDESSMELQTEVDGEQKHFHVAVLPVMYDADSIEQAFDAGFEYLDSVYLGENESADQVKKDLNLIDEIEDLGLDVSWEIDRDDCVDFKGAILDGDYPEPVLVNLTATLSYEDFQAVRQYPIRITGKEKTKTEQVIDQLKEQIRFMQLQSNDSRQLELPAELDGYAITTKKSIPLPFIVFLLCVSIGVLLVCKGYSDLHKAGQKRNQELMQAYPSFVDLLSLYMGAGLTVKGALLKIVTMTDSRILSEEINYTLNEIRSGIPETEGYYRLGNRLELPVYLKMMTLLSQNIRKGTRDILNMLAEEELSALQLKRELAKKKGEEAGTRLLFPMILQLGVVMIIVIAPALMGF